MKVSYDMTKKLISVFISTLLCLSLAVPTLADESTVFGTSDLNIPDPQPQVNSEIMQEIEDLQEDEIQLGEPGTFRLGSMETFDGELDLSNGTTHSSSITENKSRSLQSIAPNSQNETPEALAENNPPVASLEYVILNPESLYNNQVTKETQIAWLYSYEGTDYTYDPDGDAITGMYIGGIPQECIVGELPGMGFVTQFPQIGTFTLLFQAEDEHGALSDVWGMNITVVGYSALRNIKMNTRYGSTVTPSYPNSKGYLDYQASMSMTGTPEYVWDATISQDYPYDLPRDYFYNDVEISGVVTHPNGTPRANERVIILMPLTGKRALTAQLTTDASGKFSIKKNVAKDIYSKETNTLSGDCSGLETKYAWVSKDVRGQDFYYPTELTIACNYQVYKQEVTATVGYTLNCILLGGRWVWSADPANGDYELKWR